MSLSPTEDHPHSFLRLVSSRPITPRRPRRLRSRHRRLAHVGRYAGPQHGVEHDGPADVLGRQGRNQREVGRGARVADLWQPGRVAGVVFVGTNNEKVRDPKQGGDRGVLMAFRESDGEFIWQITHEKLSSGRVNDWPYQGVCSSPLVENGMVYYVSNRGEVIAADLQGFRATARTTAREGRKVRGQNDADILWRFDMMEEVGAFPHNMSNSSPVVFGDLIFVSTSNGQDESHVNVPSPKAPAIIAINKTTGKLAWEDNSVGDRMLHGQWSSPTVARIGDTTQVMIGQGDGWLRGYEATSGKKLWEFDTNPKDSVWPKTRNELISTPVVYDGIVYIANGQDPEHGEGVGHLYAIDPTKRGDITKTGMVWHYDKIRRSISTAAVATASCTSPTSAASSTRGRKDRQGVLDARHVRRGLGLGARRGREGLSRGRGRRRHDPAGGQGAEGPRRDEHGQLGLRDRGPGKRRADHRQPQPALLVLDEEVVGGRRDG